MFEGRFVMKKNLRRCLALLCMLVLTTAFLAGCGTKAPYEGKWSYIHDDQVVALEIKGNKATVDGYKCSVTMEGDVLKLSADNGMKFEVGPSDTEGQVILYKYTEYEYEGEGTPDGLVGLWKSKENWSFEFTNQGTFKEDEYFPGYYFTDENDTNVTLIYNDHFTDTTCQYSIEGTTLTVRYPWPMVKTAAK